MKDFHRSFICRSTETEKRGHRSKSNSNKNEVCKCFAPFLKLHYYDCPVAKKICPVHGSPYRHCDKDEKTEKKDNMIISFHPSSKTDKLFRPVKNLLAHCNSETKINLEYYIPNNLTSKDSVKHRQVQTNEEELKKSIGSNIFVEKTKSFVTDKTNRMKRLKQCFYSPCNSIVARTRSQTTVKEKINENFREEAKCAAVATGIPEEPSDDMYFHEKSKWTSSNKLDSSDWEKSSNDKLESDFVTVTKQTENQIIDHKIFEIRHKKGFSDVHFTKLPRQSPFVYASFDTEKSKNVSIDSDIPVDPPSDQKKLEKYSNDNELMKRTVVKDEISTSGKSQSSSSGSVYFTPFILKPGVEEGTTDRSKYADDTPKETPKNLGDEVKVGDMKWGKPSSSEEMKIVNEASSKPVSTTDRFVQTEPSALEKSIYDTSISTSENSTLSKSFEPYKEASRLRQERGVGSRRISSSIKFLYSPQDSMSKTSGKKESYSMINVSETTSKSLNKSTQMSPPNSRTTDDYDLYSNEIYDAKSKAKPADPLTVLEETSKRLADKKFRSTEVQTDLGTLNESKPKREVSLVYDDIKKVADKITQTNRVITRDVKVETVATKKNKSQMTDSTTAKSVQTSFTLSDSQSLSNEGEFINLDSNVNFMVSSCISAASSRDVNKSRWTKSRSDGDIYDERTSNPANEIFQHICLCDNLEASNSECDLNSYEKIDKAEKSNFEKNNVKPLSQNRIEPRSSTMKKEVASKGEQAFLFDLSELTWIVNQFFDKMSKEAFKACECEKIKKKESKTNQEIKLDSPKSIIKPKLNDAEVQTTFRVIFAPSEEDKAKDNWENVKFRWSVPQQDDCDTIFLCTKCRQDKSVLCRETSTATDDLLCKKKVLLLDVGTSTDSLTKTVDIPQKLTVCVPNLIDCFLKESQPAITEKTSVKEPADTPLTSNSPCENNGTFTGHSMPKDGSNKSLGRKVLPPNDQLSEKKSIRKNPNSNSWKPIDSSLLNETEKIYKTSNLCKPKPPPGRDKSNIPSLTCTTRKTINFREKDATAGTFAMSSNQKCFKTQAENCASTISIKQNTICISERPCVFESKPPKPPLKIEPSNPNKNPTKCYRKPSVQIRQQQQQQQQQQQHQHQPGASHATANRNTPPQKSKKSSSHKTTITYPIIFRPMLYKDFKKTWQNIKKCQGKDSSSSTLELKRCSEAEEDSLGGKRIKGRDNGSGETSPTEEINFTSIEKNTINMNNGSGFVWFPSAPLQTIKAETKPACLRGTRSERKLPKHSQSTSLFKGFNKRTAANLLSVKSCRLSPVQVNEKHPFKKLFDYRFCKSLSILKNDQKEPSLNEQPSDGAFGYEPAEAKVDSSTSDDENSESIKSVFSFQIEDNYFRGCSFPPDPRDSPDLTESSDLENDDPEEKIERTERNFFSPSRA